MMIFGDGIARIASNCLKIVLLELTNPSSLFQWTHLLPQTLWSPSGGEWCRMNLTGGWRRTDYSIWCGLLEFSCFWLSEHIQIHIFFVNEGICGFLFFLVWTLKMYENVGLLFISACFINQVLLSTIIFLIMYYIILE